MKKILVLVVILFIPTVLIVYEIINSKRKNKTFIKKIKGKVSSVQKQNRGGTKYYYASNIFFIEADFNIDENQIVVNDSVFKNKNSKELNVYKKNVATINYKYYFWKIST